MKEALDEGVRAPIRQAKFREGVECGPLLGRASAIPFPHAWHSRSAVRFRLGLRIEFMVVDVAQPAVQDLIPHDEQRPICSWISDVREGRENPVSALPFRIWVPDRPEAAAR